MLSHFDFIMNEKRFRAIIQMNQVLIITVFSLLVLLIISIGGNVLLAWTLKNKGQPEYFATTTDGRLYALKSLNEPILSQIAVSTFAERVLLKTFSFNYLNSDDVFTSVRGAYSNTAFDSLMRDLHSEHGLIEDAKKNKYLVSALLLSAPQLLSQGVDSITGRYTWQYRYPIQLTFQNENTTLSARFDMTVTLVRVDQRNNPFGMEIDKVIASEVKTDA